MFTQNVQLWNKNLFGNIFSKKQRLLARADGLKTSCHYLTRFFLQNLERTLQIHYQQILIME